MKVVLAIAATCVAMMVYTQPALAQDLDDIEARGHALRQLEDMEPTLGETIVFPTEDLERRYGDDRRDYRRDYRRDDRRDDRRDRRRDYRDDRRDDRRDRRRDDRRGRWSN
ncbi:hypothetical protein Poli38472_011542 [Pythium oligandrum]|uniref:Uncharacterized protein n=1 Tax=Pythium oligandrum TaxID=41045 RepID=A0A8K1CLT1_PYTOL|nr:hypothetical protein Poli38472_011542 [Pythium oligandrum]|eukprot:TMW64662.1 hypothetical protein Poli38472_011542 [Pythium oligandrum]